MNLWISTGCNLAHNEGLINVLVLSLPFVLRGCWNSPEGVLRKLLRSFIHLCVKIAAESGIALNQLVPVGGGTCCWKSKDAGF